VPGFGGDGGAVIFESVWINLLLRSAAFWFLPEELVIVVVACLLEATIQTTGRGRRVGRSKPKSPTASGSTFSRRLVFFVQYFASSSSGSGSGGGYGNPAPANGAMPRSTANSPELLRLKPCLMDLLLLIMAADWLLLAGGGRGREVVVVAASLLRLRCCRRRRKLSRRLERRSGVSAVALGRLQRT